MNAPNTPRAEITRDGPYHVVNSSTCSTGDYTPAKCRKCKVVADPSHVTNGPRESLQVWCEIHCLACIAFRNPEVTDRQRENRRKSEIAVARTLSALKNPPAEVLRANKYLSAETAESRLKRK